MSLYFEVGGLIVYQMEISEVEYEIVGPQHLRVNFRQADLVISHRNLIQTRNKFALNQAPTVGLTWTDE